MIDPRFVLLGTAISIIASLFLARAVLDGGIRPNRVSWFLWAVVPLIAFCAQIAQGVGLSALMTFSVTIAPMLVFACSFLSPHASWRIRPFDIVCGAIAGSAVAMWLILDDPDTAILMSILADAAAAVPTLIKAWRSPETESAAFYFAAGTNGIITVLTLQSWTFAEAAFPVYIAVATPSLAIVVAIRRRVVDPRPNDPAAGQQIARTPPEPSDGPRSIV
ncbi:hypothetical protein [Gordonia sp. GN26]